MFPLFLDLTDRLVVVIGGGAVGRRRAAAVRAAGGRVRLVCLEPRPAQEIDPDLDWVTAAYEPAHLEGAALILAAGPPEVNAQVLADGRTRGVWVNTASPPPGDFLLPATVQRGDLVVAVGTSGAAPALARNLCRRLEAELDDSFTAWVDLLAELRPVIRREIRDPAYRRQLLKDLCSWSWLDHLRRTGVESTRQSILAIIATADPPT